MGQVTKPKRIFRSRKDRKLGGVCGGIADYFNVDPTWIRLLFILLSLLSLGTLVIIYMIFWMIVPLEPIQTGSSNHECSNCK